MADKKRTELVSTEIGTIEVTEELLREKLYEIRGVKVMLDAELATKQSKALVRTFKKMKDYIIGSKGLIGQREVIQLSLQTIKNAVLVLP